MKRTHLALLWMLAITSIFLLGLLVPIDAYAKGSANCTQCTEIRAKLQQEEDLKKRIADLIEKNKAFMAKLSPDDASKRVKVNSNLLVANVQYETRTNNILALNEAIEAQGCKQCPVNSQ